MGGKPSGNTNSVQTSSPWGPQQPYLESIFSGAKNLYENQTPQYFPNSTVSPVTPQQFISLANLENAATTDPLQAVPSATIANLAQGQSFHNPAFGIMSGLASNNYGDMANTAQQPFYNNNFGYIASQPQTPFALNNQAVPANQLTAPFQQANSGMLANQLTAPFQQANSGMLANDITKMFVNNNAGYVANPLTQGFVDNNAGFGANMLTNPFVLNNQSYAAPGSEALSSYASGERAAFGNPYLDAVSNSIISKVTPRIQSQFVGSGMLGSPETARATAEGTASALAPFSFGQYQQDQQNQINAANSLANRFMQGAGMQQQAASEGAGRLLQGSGLQQAAADAAAGRLFQGFSRQQDAADAAAGRQLQGAGLQQSAADSAAGRLLQGAGLQQSAADSAAGRLLQGAGLQQSAAGDISRLLMQGFGNQQSAASDMANRYLQGAGLQASAANNYGSLASGAYGDMLKAAALAPSVQATQYTPAEMMFQSGSARQALGQQGINDAVQRWNFEQSLPYNQLNQYIGQVTGNYGGTTTLNQPYFSNPGQNALSGGLGGAMLGSSLLGPAGLDLVSAGAGSGLGAGLGALMMLFSDPRLKEDAEPVGTLDNGMTVYRYRYIDDPPEMRRIGLMADEVERERPDAVAYTGPEWGALGGMRMVDYARATEPA